MADYTSPGVPTCIFAASLKPQEEALATNPMLQRMHESHGRMVQDPHRPIYHYVNPESSLNNPNGLCFWQDRWHLFYHAYPPEAPRQHWSHAVSTDRTHPCPYIQHPPRPCAWIAALQSATTGTWVPCDGDTDN